MEAEQPSSVSTFIVFGIRCGLKLHEIYELTPAELYYYILAWLLDRDEYMQNLAWQTAMIISYTNRLKKPVKPQELYQSPTKRKIIQDPEKLKKEYYEIVKELLPKGGEKHA